jgi:hypothetical protein
LTFFELNVMHHSQLRYIRLILGAGFGVVCVFTYQTIATAHQQIFAVVETHRSYSALNDAPITSVTDLIVQDDIVALPKANATELVVDQVTENNHSNATSTTQNETHRSYIALDNTRTARVADLIVQDDIVALPKADATELVVDQVTENNHNNTTSTTQNNNHSTNNNNTPNTTQNNNHTTNNTSIQYIYQGVCKEPTDGEVFGGSKRLITTSKRDLKHAWWVIECKTGVKEANESMYRRIEAFTGLNYTDGERSIHNLTKETMDEILGEWRIMIIDYSDIPSMDSVRWFLESVAQVVGWERVYFVTRSTTANRGLRNRHLLPEKYVTRILGERTNFTQEQWVGIVCAGVKHFHFAVRDDVKDALDEDLVIITNETGISDPVDLPRPKDAAHFWNANMTRQAVLRTSVSREVMRLAALHPERNLTLFCDIVGNKGKKGRNGISHEYIRALLEFKIVVLAQRDRWEDHLRLFEAMTSGALVISDQALDFPWGVVDTETIVVYKTMEEMQDKILYYLDHREERLRIARAGRDLALNHHRERHRYEDLILGDWSQRDEYGVSLLRP